MPLSEAQLRPYSQNIRLKENLEPTTPTPFNSTFSSTISVIENQVCAVKNIFCVEFQIFMLYFTTFFKFRSKVWGRSLVSSEKLFFQKKKENRFFKFENFDILRTFWPIWNSKLVSQSVNHKLSFEILIATLNIIFANFEKKPFFNF